MGGWLDEVARELARGQSRRGVLKRLGRGLAAATVAAALVVGRAEASHKPKHHKPKPKSKCKGGCDSPESRCCDGVCAVVTFDRLNCGECGNVCPDGADCCGGRCIPVRGNDPSNCGCCGCGCLPDREICVNGSCIEI